ncbi:uncharacterized protein TNIN_194161 [Trichonephila inaurata madagascariensis]|uniref:Uncharacterized protein n=1 Tax=Trichonephila inaurata madagascariensis TaxID=2747483 RepID=A0A8X7BZ73_9ARAC|nr:uncharacterized protein TNIN_194161 [Trichonephila inaurata madagascariensis]
MTSSEGNVEVVQFNERFCGRKIPKKQNKPPEITKIEDTSTEAKEFNIKRARYEVMKFGISGFDKERQKQDKIALAIRLGAKPPKKEYTNYKVLMEQKKKQKEERKAKKATDQYVLKKLIGRKKTHSKKRIK